MPKLSCAARCAPVIFLACSTLCLGQTANGFSCNQSATPLDERAQGTAEQAGDIVLTCTGGSVTAAGFSIPQVDITVSTNVVITSRLIGGVSIPAPSEALIVMDEPGNGGPTSAVSICPSAGVGTNPNCSMTALGTGGGILTRTYDPTLTGSGARYNAFQGTQVGPGQVTFYGVPVDPPGVQSPSYSPVGNLIMRITDLRVNASGLGIPADFSVNAVFATISTSAGFPVINNVQTVGNVRNGINVSAANLASFAQCTSQTLQPAFTVNVQEGFPTAFKQRFPVNPAHISVAGNDYSDSESTFVPLNAPLTSATPGVADFGTRVKLSFANVPPGVMLYIPVTVNSSAQGPSGYSAATLTSSESGPYSLVSPIPGTGGLAAVTNGTAIYELTQNKGSYITDTFSIPVSISYSATSPANYPPNGTASVAVGFAPVAGSVPEGNTGPIPQFRDIPTTMNGFSITACSNFLATPSSVSLTGTGSQPVSLTSSGGSTSFTVTPDGQSFYGVTSSGSSTPATLTFNANPTYVLPGYSYTGSVKVQPATGPALTIPVSLSVPQSQFSANPVSYTFNSPGSHNISITSTAGPLQFSTSVSGTWLSVTTNSNTTPATLTITASTGSLTPGNYSGSVTLNALNASGTSQLVIPVYFNVSLPTSRIGVFQSGTWALESSGNGIWDGPPTDKYFTFAAGAGDIAVTGDWNGDGKTKAGIYHNGFWLLDYNGNGQWDGPSVDRFIALGGNGAGEIPVVGDWNGDGKTKVGFYYKGFWALDYNGNGVWDGPSGGDRFIALGGNPGETPVVGDWNGDHRTKVGYFVNGTWALDYNGNGVWDGATGGDRYYSFSAGAGDKPVVGDWSGTHTDKIGVYHAGFWLLDFNGNGQWDGTGIDRFSAFGGNAGEVPVVGDWNGDGTTKIGFYLNGFWALDYNGNGAWDGPNGGDRFTALGGKPGEQPLVGKW